LKTKQFCETSSIFEIGNVKNEAILRASSIFELGIVKNEAILRASSIFEVDNIKNEAILRDFLQKWKVECRADGLVPMHFAISLLHLSKVLRLPRKSQARSYEVLHLSRKIILEKPNGLMHQNATPLRKSAPRPPNMSDEHVSLVSRLPREMHLCRSSSNVPRLLMSLKLLQNITNPPVLLTFRKVRNPLRLPRATTSDVQKWSEHVAFFSHFDFEMSFAPQHRALFHHINS